jgi:flagellar hook protein FlgE
MNGIAALSSAILGMRTNVEKLNATAERIARTAPLGDLPADMVDLVVARRGFESNVVTVKTVDEAIGTLLDAVR